MDEAESQTDKDLYGERAHEPADISVAQHQSLLDTIKELDANRLHWVSQYIAGFSCQPCRDARQGRLRASISASVREMSQKEIDIAVSALEAPMTADELLLPEEIENARLKAKLARLYRAMEVVLQTTQINSIMSHVREDEAIG